MLYKEKKDSHLLTYRIKQMANYFRLDATK